MQRYGFRLDNIEHWRKRRNFREPNARSKPWEDRYERCRLGIFIVLGDFIPLGLLLVIRRYSMPTGLYSGTLNIFLGLSTIAFTTGVLYFGLTGIGG